MGMRLLYVNVIEENRGWGAEFFVNKGFLDYGIQTQNLDYRKHRYELYQKFNSLTDFDAFLLQRGDGFPLDLIKAVNRPRFFWASELVSRCRDQDRLLCSGLFNHIFVHTNACRRTVIENGWGTRDNVSVLLNGFDPDEQHPLPCVEKDIDVLYYGTVTPRRKALLDELGKKFNVHISKDFGIEMTKTVSRSKILLNIHAEDHLDIETRIFEGLGYGAFVISEKLSEDSPFQNGKHLVEVESIAEMEEQITYYLDNCQEREKIAAQGHSEAMERHTYGKRAIEIAKVMERYVEQKTDTLPVDRKILDVYSIKEVLAHAKFQCHEGAHRALTKIKGR